VHYFHANLEEDYSLFRNPASKRGFAFKAANRRSGERQMSVPPFNSINEAKKPVEDRVYHNNDRCRPGKDIRKKRDDLERRDTGCVRIART
jgi:hypothetical protein